MERLDMEKLNQNLIGLFDKYGTDFRRALRENKRLEYLQALAVLRENLLEWYAFRPQGRLLQVGADSGALTELFVRRLASVTVLDESEENLEVVRRRFQGREGLSSAPACVRADLVSFAERAGEEGRSFDYVTIAGTFSEQYPKADQIAAARSLLAPGGVLIVAACNPFGAKYLAGAPRDAVCASRRELQKLLPGGRFYYPMPDYRLASELYSDAYLPQKGDLCGALAVYDYPAYLLMDVGGLYDAACEDGRFDQFANSFLVFEKQGTDGETADAASPVVYVKYNRTRQDRFQIKTEICREDGGRLSVRKTALCPKGRDHIRSFAEKYRLLSRQSAGVRLAEPAISEDGMCAEFPYLEGRTLAQLLSEKLRGPVKAGDEAAEAIRRALNLVCGGRSEDLAPFCLTPDFMEVFQSLEELPEEETLKELLADQSFTATNIDALFENMLVLDEQALSLCAIDYEWVFLFPIPCGFLRWRVLNYFYSRSQSLLGGQTKREFLAAFAQEIPQRDEILDLYEKMERGFQEYVHGENQRTYQEDYMIKTKTLRELAQVDGELSRARERAEQLKAENRQKDAALRKLQEVHRLTNNHVANLEVMIGDLRHEIGEMGKTLAYLNRHEALAFKVRRKLGQAFNRRYPKGSAARKKMGYAKNAVFHPFASARLFTTEEGKNRIRGDFEIGEEYLLHGKLAFAREEQPLVSIVIPVYNQIRYTYLCLQSIMEHTKDVRYEIIIADDVSTDATEHLAEFAKNLVICRNEVNQGFLKNCNRAARLARGRYLMFLNNDTQVTEGWLSSLVELIESDETIGMVGSKLVYPDGRLQEAGGIIWSDGSGWNYGRLDDPEKAEYNYVKEVDYISGAAILLGRDLWERIGGFDERYAPAYCEDSDLAFEVRKAGYRVVYQPRSKVIHFEGVSNGTDVEGTGLKRYQAENSEKLREKWKDELKKQCVNTGNPSPFRARERSMGKKILVVIDHYVPTWDRDAGSKTTFQYLKLFLKKGYVVKFVGDNYLHEEPYTGILQQMGIEVLYGQEYLTGIWDWLEKNGKEIHAVYLNRPHIATKYVDFISDHTDIRMIYYGHDLHFLREFREYELTGDVKKRQESEYWKAIEFSLMHKVAVSYYPSQVEADAIRAQDDTIPVKAITAYVYENFLDRIEEDFAKREGLLFVGGFAHPPNADAVLWFVREVFPLIRKALGKVNFYVVGSRVTDEIQALHSPEQGVIIRGFVSDEELAALYQSCRIVAVPLRYGAGVKGKVVEALYHGAPVVTTSVGSEGIPQAGEVMEVADGAEAFAAAVIRLYGDAGRLLEMSKKTQRYIREHYSVEAAWETIRDDFR